MVQRAGRIWFSTHQAPPPLTGGEFGDGWTFLGYPDDADRHVTAQEWKRAREGARGRPLEFWILAEDDVDVDALPDRVWLGVDPTGAGGTTRLVSAAQVSLHAPLERRAPEAPPGRLGPHKPVSVRTGTTGGVSFRPVV